MDEERLGEIENEAQFLRSQTGAHRWIHLCNACLTLIGEVRRLRSALERSRNRYEALEGEGFYVEGVGETAWAMHADAVEALRGEEFTRQERLPHEGGG